MFAQALLAMDLSEHRIWAVQAAGFATAGLVLMCGRFLTGYRFRNTVGAPSRSVTPKAATSIQDWQRKPHGYRLPSDLAFKVEETWR
jgi:hypothetical protein